MPDIAEEPARLDPADKALPFRLLSRDRALGVFEALDPFTSTRSSRHTGAVAGRS